MTSGYRCLNSWWIVKVQPSLDGCLKIGEEQCRDFLRHPHFRTQLLWPNCCDSPLALSYKHDISSASEILYMIYCSQGFFLSKFSMNYRVNLQTPTMMRAMSCAIGRSLLMQIWVAQFESIASDNILDKIHNNLLKNYDLNMWKY